MIFENNSINRKQPLLQRVCVFSVFGKILIFPKNSIIEPVSMTICFPHSSQRLVEDWAKSFQFGNQNRRRKSVINGIIYFYSFHESRLLSTLTVPQVFDTPVADGYELNAKSKKIVDSLLGKFKDKGVTMEPWQLVHLLVEQSKLEEAQLRKYLKKYIEANIKCDPNQFWFALEDPIRQKVERAYHRSRTKEDLSVFISNSLELFAANKSERDMAEKLEGFCESSPGVGGAFICLVLTFNDRTSEKISRVGWRDVDAALTCWVEMAVEEQFGPRRPRLGSLVSH